MKVVVADADLPVDGVPAAMTERDEARATVRDALRSLPETQREALVLAYWGGLTADEIAERSRVPLGTAKSRIRLGLAKLRTECAHELAAA
jgi:RNA polymerase sigma-70 factor (ECF subfamily)